MPSRIYWNALKLWGVLQPRGETGKPPGQAELHARWTDLTHQNSRHDELSHEKAEPIFIDLPPAPEGWTKKESELSFDLSDEEIRLVKAGWRTSAEAQGAPESLMSKLAHAEIRPKSMWSKSVSGLASADDKAALLRAEKAASLVCIGRALYAAMIEQLKDADIVNGKKPDLHLNWLEELRQLHAQNALSLDLKELAYDVPRLSDQLFRLLRKIQEWSDRGGSFEGLKMTFLDREVSLKGSRAMLAPPAFKRREAWLINQRAEPLNYRWHIVSGFLNELSA